MPKKDFSAIISIIGRKFVFYIQIFLLWKCLLILCLFLYQHCVFTRYCLCALLGKFNLVTFFYLHVILRMKGHKSPKAVGSSNMSMYFPPTSYLLVIHVFILANKYKTEWYNNISDYLTSVLSMDCWQHQNIWCLFCWRWVYSYRVKRFRKQNWWGWHKHSENIEVEVKNISDLHQLEFLFVV